MVGFNDMPKVALLTNIIHPPRIPVFNHYHSINPNFKVFYMVETHSNRLWKIDYGNIKYDYEILKGFNYFSQRLEFGIHFNVNLLKYLMENNSDVIVCTGYDTADSFLALAYAKITKKKIVLWHGSTALSGRSDSRAIDKLKSLFIRGCNSYLAYGSLAKEYLMKFGANESKIITSCNAVDIEKYSNYSNKSYLEKEALKREKGYPDIVLLYVGQLIDRKGLPVLLKAIKGIGRDDLGIVIIGEGPSRKEYEDLARQLQIRNVFFEGHQNEPDIIKYYAIADIFVMPSFIEVWGLVVNEAMACGLPIICSSRAGVCRDLVKDGENGYGFDPHDHGQLTEIIGGLIDDRVLMRKMGERSREIISKCTPEKYATDLRLAIDIAMQS